MGSKAPQPRPDPPANMKPISPSAPPPLKPVSSPPPKSSKQKAEERLLNAKAAYYESITPRNSDYPG